MPKSSYNTDGGPPAWKESTRSGANTSRSCKTTSGWPACPAPVATCESDRDGLRTSKQDAMAAVASRLGEACHLQGAFRTASGKWRV